MDKYFQVRYLPIYSSELSSVETVWALLKAKVRPEFTKLLIRKKCTKKRFIETVQNQIALIDRQTYINLCRANYDDLWKLIQRVDIDYNAYNPFPGKL